MVPLQSADQRSSRCLSIAILQRFRLDGEALAAIIRQRHEFKVIAVSSTLPGLTSTCDRFKPDLAIVDAAFPVSGGDIFSTTAGLIDADKLQWLLFLDTVPSRLRAIKATQLSSTGYVLRQRSFGQLVTAIHELVAGHPPNDGAHPQENGSEVHFSRIPALSPLTPREREVFQLIAEGQSVGECAQSLNVARKTVDNHKARLMKKLGVSKSVHLTRLAIRAGVIVP